MKILKIQSLLFTIFLGISSILTYALADTSLIDVNYQFDQTKLEASVDSFHFLRSFVDYYYKLIPSNAQSLNLGHKASRFSGWCAGDAHPENFGTLLQDNSTVIFGMNDMDDSGPCLVAYDFLRLLVSSRLYWPQLKLEKTIDFYLRGLDLENVAIPSYIQSLVKSGQIAGSAVNPKDIQGNLLKRKKNTIEVTSADRLIIENSLKELFLTTDFISENIKVIDVLSKLKEGGGSGGLLRYEILCSLGSGEKLHLELKELTVPGISSIAFGPIPNQKSRMHKSLLIEQGDKTSHYYTVLLINGKSMLLRPKFFGNIGITLSENLITTTNNSDVINYEAYLLGRIHAQTVDVSQYRKALTELKAYEWENDVNAFTKHFNQKFIQQKN